MLPIFATLYMDRNCRCMLMYVHVYVCVHMDNRLGCWCMCMYMCVRICIHYCMRMNCIWIHIISGYTFGVRGYAFLYICACVYTHVHAYCVCMDTHCMCIYVLVMVYAYLCVCVYIYIQPITNRVAKNLEIISLIVHPIIRRKKNQRTRILLMGFTISHVINCTNHTSHENPGTPGTKLKVFRHNLKILLLFICNWLYVDAYFVYIDIMCVVIRLGWLCMRMYMRMYICVYIRVCMFGVSVFGGSRYTLCMHCI